MQKLSRIEVGKPFEYRDAEKLYGMETFILEWDYSGYILIIAFPNMTSEEIRTIGQNKVRVNALREGNYILLIWEFEGTSIIGDTPFDPTTYEVNDRSRLLESNLITIIGVDSWTMEVTVIRVANLPHRWRKDIVNIWENALRDPGYNFKYNDWIDKKNNLNLFEIKKQAKFIGYLGEGR